MDCQTVYLNVAVMKSLPKQLFIGAWPVAVSLLERWLQRGERADALLESAGRRAPDAWSGEERARCQHLLFGALRHYGRLNAAVTALVGRPPRARLRAVLLVAGFELLEAGMVPGDKGQAARIVHHAVDQAKILLSPAEARLVNAVLRRFGETAAVGAAPPAAGAGATELAGFFSHPEWLVRRWLAQFGAEATHRLLQWNQTPPPVYGRWRPAFAPAPVAGSPGSPPPPFLEPTGWTGFYVVPAGHWPEVEQGLADGTLYLQDPATLIAAELLDPQPAETVLDLCAAPGGKSLLLADLLEARALQNDAGASTGLPDAGSAKAGRVVAVDQPDPRRIARLKENLAKVHVTGVTLVQADVRKLTPALLGQQGLPAAYSAILLDAPCSNTGVMRHRVDVKWRLRETDIAQHAAQQLALLTAAARLLAPGGRLVYSTCSLEPEENEGVVEAFLQTGGGRLSVEQSRHSRPWETGCDGAAAFLLRKNA
jgi:16S rRNA (cytosine967-C5)-methyltransferase